MGYILAVIIILAVATMIPMTQRESGLALEAQLDAKAKAQFLILWHVAATRYCGRTEGSSTSLGCPDGPLTNAQVFPYMPAPYLTTSRLTQARLVSFVQGAKVFSFYRENVGVSSPRSNEIYGNMMASLLTLAQDDVQPYIGRYSSTPSPALQSGGRVTTAYDNAAGAAYSTRDVSAMPIDLGVAQVTIPDGAPMIWTQSVAPLPANGG